MSQAASQRSVPEAGALSASFPHVERLAEFGLDNDAFKSISDMWPLINDGAQDAAAAYWHGWHEAIGSQGANEPPDPNWLASKGIVYFESRHCDVGGKEWIARAERSVCAAFQLGIPLSRLNRILSAASKPLLQKLFSATDIDDLQRHKLIASYFSLRDYESDLFSSFYIAYEFFDTTAQRQRISNMFNESVSLILKDASSEEEKLSLLTQETAHTARHMRSRVNEIGKEVCVSADATQAAALRASELETQLDQFRDMVESTTDIAAQASSIANESREKSLALSAHADVAASILDMVRDVARHTNLLALNATIEAARCGDAGRGFAVVASEVKSLARKTALAVEEVSVKVADISASSRLFEVAVSDIAKVIDEISAIGSTLSKSALHQSQIIEGIGCIVTEISDSSKTISDSLDFVNEEASKISDKVDQIEFQCTSLKECMLTLHQSSENFATEVGTTSELALPPSKTPNLSPYHRCVG